MAEPKALFTIACTELPMLVIRRRIEDMIVT
jgi:hypothetical protein